MKSRAPFAFAFGVAAAAWLGTVAAAQPAPEPTDMHMHGIFDVDIHPQQPDNAQAQAAQISRLSIDKRYHGALDASGQGEMLASGDGSQSGAYVAIEKVTGALRGRKGSFVLVHSAVMSNGIPAQWSVAVVPDSGTGQLTGLAGAMRITIADGKHFYDFDYSLPEP